MNKKVVLVTVNAKSALYSTTEHEYSAIQPNISMALIGSYLQAQGIETIMLYETAQLPISKCIEKIVEISPALVGVVCAGANPSASTMCMVGAINFFKEFNKTKGVITFIQGGHPSVLPKRTLDETGADFVIRGEGYDTIVRLLEHVTTAEHLCSPMRSLKEIKGLAFMCGNEFVDTGFPELIDVNTLPQVDWGAMPPSKYKAHNWHCFGDMDNRSPYGVIRTSFGCPHGCEFCCINNVFGKRSYRLRDIKSVLTEIDDLVLNHGVKHIKIMDELFVIDHPRMEEFYQGLKSREYDLNMWSYARMDSVNPVLLQKLKSVGMNWIAYGIESVSDATLKDMSKQYNRDKFDSVIAMTQDAGISICADVIAGLWEDTVDDMQRTYDWCVEKNFEWLNMYPLFAYPGTKMYDKYIAEGRIQEPTDWGTYALYGYKCHPMHNKHMSAAEILKWRDDKFIDYHSRPEYLSMILKRFGQGTHDHVAAMVKNRLPRELYGAVS